MEQATNTLKVRVKDKHCKLLERMAFEVNPVWNAANEEPSMWCWVPIAEVGSQRFNISGVDLQQPLKSIRQKCEFIIQSTTVQEVISSHYLSVWDSYNISQFEFRAGSFSHDARDRWFFNIVFKSEQKQSSGIGTIGIDLGLKTTATCSDGFVLNRGDFYRRTQQKLGIAQRANKHKQVKTIHAKNKNRRMDANHQYSTELVKNNQLVVVGNVSSSGLAKTKMTKSVLDAGWYQLKTQLEYKSKAMRVAFAQVNESYTTQACSYCGCISDNSPQGSAGLGTRAWTCAECGTTHDSDINAVKNILALGYERLAVGIPLLLRVEDVKEAII